MSGSDIRKLGLYRDGAGAGLRPVFGPAADAAMADAIADMQAGPKASRPGVRKIEAGYVIRVPLAPTNDVVWLIAPETVPDAAAVKALCAEAQALFGAAQTPDAAAGPAADIVRALAMLPRGRGRRATRRALEAISAATGWTGLAAIQIRNGRARAIREQAVNSGPKPASIRIFATQMLSAGETTLLVDRARVGSASAENAGTESAETPDRELYLQTHDLERFAISLPDGDGIGLYCEGDVTGDAANAARAALSLKLERPTQARKRSLRGFFVMTAATAAAVLLLWPVRFEIGAPAEIEPARSETVALAYEGRLTTLHRRIGEAVASGDLLAKLDSAELAEEEKQATLDQMLEALSAQEALASDDYASFQLAEQRKAIAQFRAEQSQRRLDALSVTAPTDGKLVFIITEKSIGTVLPAGSPVAEIQIGTDMRARLTLAGGDGRLVTRGMTGDVVVRGLVDRTFPIEILEDPQANLDEAGGQVVTVLAKVDAPEDARLIKGLTGFARIDAGTERRIWVWTRPIVEFLRLRTWMYLGLRL